MQTFCLTWVKDARRAETAECVRCFQRLSFASVPRKRPAFFEDSGRLQAVPPEGLAHQTDLQSLLVEHKRASTRRVAELFV